MSISKVNDLNVYRTSFELAMKIFQLSIDFPKEEILTNRSDKKVVKICGDKIREG